MSVRRSVARARALAVLVLAATSAACYRLTPLEGPTPEPGRVVRVDLTDAGSVRLAPFIGPRVEAIEGRAERTTDSSYVLLVTATTARGGMSTSWSNERLDVPLSAVARIRPVPRPSGDLRPSWRADRRVDADRGAWRRRRS